MPTNPVKSLSRAATSTFESLAFLVPEECPAAGAELVPLAAGASVTWRGPLAGRVVVGVADGVLRAVATNMLGTAGDDPAVRRDALGELANVVTGNVLPLVAGAEAVFRLDAPQVHDGAPSFAPAPGEARAAIVHLRFDEGDAVVAFFAAAAREAA